TGGSTGGTSSASTGGSTGTHGGTTGSATSAGSTGGTTGAGSTGGTTGAGSTGGTTGSIPTPPTLGAEIDRMGRAGVNTALTDAFDTLGSYSDGGIGAGGAPDDGGIVEGQAKDLYNAASDPTTWGQFVPWLASNLAIVDSLDDVCGNQLLAKPASDAGVVPPDRYATLATVLSDDELYLNSTPGVDDGGTPLCSIYLGLEANAVGIANTDCGGRTPLENTIDETYSLLAAGTLTGVTNGITSDADHTASLTVFPYLQPAN
ncbi:MAG: hypothetical protein ACYCWW_11530, partial [Deltaproteobacteria bacterium]